VNHEYIHEALAKKQKLDDERHQEVMKEIRAKAPIHTTASKISLTVAYKILADSELVAVNMDEEDIPADETENKELTIDWENDNFKVVDAMGKTMYSEVAATPDVRLQIEAFLTKAELTGRDKFKVVDYHNQVLFNNIPFGPAGGTVEVEVSGKTDIIIVPYNSNSASYARQLRVVYGLKSPTQYNGCKRNQIAEQLLSCRVSNHPVMTVFSDQSTRARVCIIKGAELLVAEDVTPFQAAQMICIFLKDCSFSPSYQLPTVEEGKESEQPFQAGLLRVKNSAPGVSEMLERHLDLIDSPHPLLYASQRLAVYQQFAPYMVPPSRPVSMSMYA
jgi:hypothetical protein